MGNSQQGTGAESTGSLLDAVRSFDKNRIEQLSKKPEWKVSLAETDAEGNGPLHIIAKVGHYKYPPAGIPKLLIESGIDINARNYSGVTALEISLLTGWQKIAILLLDSGALKSVVTSDTKRRITCPDCKKVVRDYEL